MKYAYYEVVASEEEKKLRKAQILNTNTGDNFYSAYLEVAPRYDAPDSEKRAIRSLKDAIRRGKVQTVVLPSLENLRISELFAFHLFRYFQDREIRVAFGTPDNIYSPEALDLLLIDSQQKYIDDQLLTAIATREDCYVQEKHGYAHIHLKQDFPGEEPYTQYRIMDFVQAVETYKSVGFYLYRPDISDWYPVSDFMAEQILFSCRSADQTAWETVGMPAPTEKVESQLPQSVLDLIHSIDWTDLS